MAKSSDVATPVIKTAKDEALAKARIKNELLKRRLLIERQKRNNRLAVGLLIFVCLAVGGYLLFVVRQPSVIPGSITSKVQFPIFYPKPSKQKQVSIEGSSFKYDKSLGQVSFIAKLGNTAITFAEQSSPESFSADPNFYTTFVQKLNGYYTFSGVDGRVDLTMPTETHDQTAVMNDKGTLVFASLTKTTSKLSDSNWKLLFYGLNYTQPQ